MTPSGAERDQEVPPQVVGAAASPDPDEHRAASRNEPPETQASGFGLGWDFGGLWGGGWEEFVDEDADNIGEAYEAAVLGGVLEAEGEEQNPQPEEAPKKKKMSAKGLISNFVLSIIGSTTLGLASQMRVGGFLLAPLLLFLGFAIVAENTRLVCATIDCMQAKSSVRVLAYPDFAKGAFGIWGKRVSSVTSMCALIGMMCTTLVIEGQNFDFMLPIRWPWLGCRDCGRKWWALLLTPVTALYVFGNPGQLMKKTAFLGPIVCVLTVLFAWAGGVASIVDSGDFPRACQHPRLLLPAASDSMFLELAQVASYGFYSFAVIVTVPTLRNQMKDEKKAAPAAVFAYLISLLMFAPIMYLGYWGFGELVPENLIDGMRKDRPAGWWAMNRPWETGRITASGRALDLIVTLNLLLTEAIYIPCAVLAVEASFPGLFREGPAWAGKAMRVGFIVLRLLVATCVESFVAMSALVSSLFCVCNNIIIPVAAFHYTGAQQVSLTRKGFHVAIVLYGAIVMVLGTCSAAMSLAPGELQHEPGSFLREGITAECEAAFRREGPS